MKKSRWRFLLKVFLALAVLAGVYFVYTSIRNYYYEKDLAEVVARLDREEPGWEWKDRFARLPQLAKEENAAEEIKAIMRLLTLDEQRARLGANEWSNEFNRFELNPLAEANRGFMKDHPNARLPVYNRDEMRKLLTTSPAPEGLERARRLGRFPAGLFQHRYRPFLAMSGLPDVQGVRNLVRLQSFHAAMEMEENRPEQAASDISDMLQVARVFDHDPFGICLLVRSALVQMASHATHRLLAQSTNTSAVTLKRLQEEFMREETLMISLQEIYRWERALHDHDLKLFHHGEYTLEQYLEQYGNLYAMGSLITSWPWLDTLLKRMYPSLVLGRWAMPRHYAEERKEQLNFYGRMIAWAGLPEHELLSELKKMKQEGPGVSPFVFQLRNPYDNGKGQEAYKKDSYQGIDRIVRALLIYRAHCRCIAAALAAERYRLEHGRWPTTWEQFVPSGLPKTLLDPFTGKPLILKTLPDGLMIYSVGFNGSDEGGMIFPADKQHLGDIGYRLWNPDQRRVDMSKEFKAIEDEHNPKQ